MNFNCKHCGETFQADKETVELIENGWIQPQEVEFCQDCDPDQLHAEETELSDADTGL